MNLVNNVTEEDLNNLARLHKEYTALREKVTGDTDEPALKSIYTFSINFKSIFKKEDCTTWYDAENDCVVVTKNVGGVIFKTYELRDCMNPWFQDLFPDKSLTTN